MQASLLRSIWIFIATVIATLYTLIVSAILCSLGKMKRTDTDRYCREWSHRLLKILDIQLHTFGVENIHYEPQRRYILMCNHSSLYDIPVVFACLPGSIRMLTKKELYKIPLFSTALRQNEFIKINRHNHQEAIQDLQNARKSMESGIILWVAPEGTRSDTGELLPFKKGVFHLALETEAIIIPIGIRGTDKVLPARTLRFQLNQPVELHVGEPIDTKLYTAATRTQLMDEVRKQISELTGRESPITQNISELSYE